MATDLESLKRDAGKLADWLRMFVDGDDALMYVPLIREDLAAYDAALDKLVADERTLTEQKG